MKPLREVKRQQRLTQKEEAKNASKIEVTLRTLLESDSALNRFSMQPLPGPQALQIARVLSVLKHEVKVFHEGRVLLCKQFGKENHTTKQFEFSWTDEAGVEIENTDAFNAAYAEMIEATSKQVVKVRARKIPVEILDKMNLSADDIVQLEWLIDVGDRMLDDLVPDDED